MLTRRLALLTAATAALAGLVPAHAQDAAANWPTRPVRLVVTFPPGGSSDAAARIVAPKLAERLGQPVVVENRPGAGGGIGLDLVAKAPADGYTIVLASAGGLTANPSLYKQLSYNPERDFAPVTLFGTSPFVLLANPSLPAQNVAELLKLAKSQPGRLSYASGGNGTAMHLSGELLKSMGDARILHIPYRGSGPALLAVMSGETNLAIADLATVSGQLKSGRVKVLGVLSKERSALAPEFPTLAETGLRGYESAGWFAILAPAGTPPAIVQKLNTDITAVLRAPDVRERFAAAGLEPLPSTPQELASLMKSETAKWAKVIKESGAKLD
ncbi:tripartite tricarboxylate transporter substrate binding protein [Ramlibacter sp. AW1]|uniref:Tripartite tricarboxylate transporter substrate binding protein n=1 Tax=Ramlibacter aurantiacus TaxID=2801330 RepID=A0A936ZKR5_9BURK|nr:tripartite tricarboxylate transporter substrate binding protein [Ramlibacter aurantiacus]MBL0422682.1 tripartite tricarboxylate transporter substrate binding protein [Ramlibacter aurantiacus]